jgi:hypothetical protein
VDDLLAAATGVHRAAVRAEGQPDEQRLGRGVLDRLHDLGRGGVDDLERLRALAVVADQQRPAVRRERRAQRQVTERGLGAGRGHLEADRRDRGAVGPGAGLRREPGRGGGTTTDDESERADDRGRAGAWKVHPRILLCQAGHREGPAPVTLGRPGNARPVPRENVP